MFGYEADEVLGRPHTMFVDPADARSAAYAAFWRELRSGSAQSQRFRRLAKSGREVWLEASYTPVLDADGQVLRVVKVATDITAHALTRARLSAGARRAGQAASDVEELAHAVQAEASRTIEHANQAARDATDVVSIAAELEGKAASLSHTVHAISASAQSAANVAVQAVQSALFTSHAVVELGKRSDEIGDATAIRAICEVIDEVSAHQRSIAAAVEQQLDLTASVAQAAVRNAGAGRRIAASLGTVHEASRGTAQLGVRALDAARALAALASAMQYTQQPD